MLHELGTLPGPPGLGVRSLRAIRRDELAFFTAIPHDHGDLARLRLGPQVWLVVSRPDLVEHVLVADAAGWTKGVSLQRSRILLGDGLLTSENPLHARQRRLVAPAFAPRRVDAYVPVFAALADGAATRLRDGTTIDLAREMTRLTLSIVVAALFGEDLDEREADRIGDALTEALAAFDQLVTNPLGPVLQRLPVPSARRFHHARAELDDAVGRLIAGRRGDETGRHDLLSALLASGMSDVRLRDELMTLVLAGHETTANWLTWTWLELARRPAVERRLHDELATLGGRPPTAGDLPRLPFATAVLEEALRLHPPVWGIGRRARDERSLGGYRIPSGTLVTMLQYVVHRDARWWPEPDRFRPERWQDHDAGRRPRGAYFPFADGPRRCIGATFARTEALVVLATLAQRVRLLRRDTSDVPVDARITLRPRPGLRMLVEVRAPARPSSDDDAVGGPRRRAYGERR